jgi:hypothetical protein
MTGWQFGFIIILLFMKFRRSLNPSWVVMIFLFSGISFRLVSQDRVIPGRLYQPGDTLHGPRAGLVSIIPQGWMGVMPKGTELFSLMPVNNQPGQIYAYASKTSKEEIIARWRKGIKAENDINAVLTKEPYERNGATAGEFTVRNSSGRNSIYMEFKCGNYGICIEYMLIGAAQSFEENKKSLIQFCDNTTLSEPTMVSIYDNFDWAKLFSGKYITTYISNPYAKKKNELWICGNGTFKTNIKQKNIGNAPAEYKGSKKGKWEVTGKGPATDLILSYEKASPVTIHCEINDDKIYLNGERYYLMEYNECK